MKGESNNRKVMYRTEKKHAENILQIICTRENFLFFNLTCHYL